MSVPKCDFHIHTKYLGCANETMEVQAILDEHARVGATAVALTDHLNSPDKLPLHAPIRADILRAETPVDVYFGVELNFMSCDGEFAYNEEIKREGGFQFAIGGIHSTYLEEYDLDKLIETQHRHHLRTCNNPLVDVLVHPYWFGRGDFDRNAWPWFDSVKVVPKSFARELGQAARDTDTAIEINASANLIQSDDYRKEYVEYLSIIAEQGPMFSLGSDAHDVGHIERIRMSWDVAEELGLDADRIWWPSAEVLN
jgi:histidinol phosphatase-like PHP family hydrolase